MDEDMPRYSRKEWARIVDAFWEKYTGLKAWQDKNYKYVIEHGGKLARRGVEAAEGGALLARQVLRIGAG